MGSVGCISVTLFKELKKKRGFTNKSIANFIGVTEDAVKQWIRKDLIPEQHASALAELFNVDINYLYGRQAYERVDDYIESVISNVTSSNIKELTGLPDEAITNLNDGTIKRVIGELMSHELFSRLIFDIFIYIHSQNKSFSVEDSSSFDGINFPVTDSKVKRYFQQEVIQTFTSIIDDLYKVHTPEMNYNHDYRVITELFKNIHKYHLYEASLDKLVESYIKCLKGDYFDELKNMQCKDIINNYKQLAEKFDIPLDQSPGG